MCLDWTSALSGIGRSQSILHQLLLIWIVYRLCICAVHSKIALAHHAMLLLSDCPTFKSSDASGISEERSMFLRVHVLAYTL